MAFSSGPSGAFEDVHEEPLSPSEELLPQLIHFRSSGQHARAREVCLEMLASDPENTFVLNQLGYCHLALDDFEEAEKAFQKGTALDPENEDNFLGLAFLYWFRNHYGKAEDHVRKCLALNPEEEDAWFLMTEISIHREDAAQADYCLQRAAELVPESERIIELRTRIRGLDGSQEKLSHQEQEREWLSMLAKKPESEEAHLRLGLLYYDDLKNFAKAEHHFRQLLRLDPNNGSYQKVLVMSLRQQDPMVRALQLPHFLAMKILGFFEWAWKTKWGLILAFPVAKFGIIAVAVLFLLYFVVCWPVIKAYEFFSRRELRKRLGRVTFERGWQEKLHRLSLGTRATLLGSLMIGYWGLLVGFWYYEGTRDQILGVTTVLVMGAAFLLVTFGWFIQFKDAWQRRKNKASLKKLQNS